ncbi:MAG: endopeptidase La [Acidobacteria bacterium RIFCSPLOWO2_02_FULL_68_18]|nr:MAG: endopeptidase La [Acidobacteria bacterium RIFCSPLOWO2_02_FULL_68_18]OFW51931.1 MAG: endopeptidase La [Acidobacteria bacterium RIFCSPLOWO2_12_FULL_68_19]
MELHEVAVDDRTPAIPDELPILPLRDTVLFPNSFMPLAVARESSVRLIDEAISGGKLIGVFTQRDASVEEPRLDDLYRVGTASHIHKMFKLPDGSLRLIVQGLARLTLEQITETRPYLRARVGLAVEATNERDRLEIDALLRNIKTNFQQVVSLSPLLSDDLQTLAANITDAGRLADFIASSLTTIPTAVKQEVLETLDIRARMDGLNRILIKELEVLELGSKIQSQVQSEVGRNQREYFLREQMKAIQKELGESDDQAEEIEELRDKIEAAGMPEAVKKEAQRELDRLAKMPVAAAEYTVSRTYLDWLVMLPWAKRTEEVIDLARTKAVLDADHTGLAKVKDRILEYLAVRKLNPEVKGPILCFVGPPGVGKTSLARSIAQSLSRKFVRVSLGGMRDEAEIRGHRRTYIGALPGQVIQGLRRAESKNPVFILDEIDKLGADFRGDPASALLEVLDPEQNCTFRDHYLDVPFDLSEVLFITTANVLDPVPPALRDRMEVLEIPGYTEEEKLAIAREHLTAKQVRNHGLTPEQFAITDEAVSAVIRGYTREAGVRNLEREIGALCRKAARRRAEGSVEPLTVTPDVVIDLLGAPTFLQEEIEERTKDPGVAIGLAWTPAGGDVLFVEASRMPGTGTLTLTGQLGEVMKESARAALSWFRAHATAYGADQDFFRNAEVHLHVPSGAIPKDGPSAGVTIATALASEVTRRPVRGDIAMTGEITLSGRVLPVGGIKEKVLAARRAGIREVILPRQNEKNVKEDLTEELRRELTIHFVQSVDEVLLLALLPGSKVAGTRTDHRVQPRVQ